MQAPISGTIALKNYLVFLTSAIPEEGGLVNALDNTHSVNDNISIDICL